MTTNNPFADWTKMFGDFKTPTVDVTGALAQARRNAESNAKAGATVLQIWTEGAQEIARRQAEILRSNAEHALKASKELASHSTPESAAAKQADYAKQWLEFNVNSLREIAQMSTKSAQEAFDVVNKRVAEGIKEFSDAASHTTHTATSKKKAA